MTCNVPEQRLDVDADVDDDDDVGGMNDYSTLNCVSSFDEEVNLNENSTNEFTLVGPERLYYIGNDKSKGIRIWIQTVDDPSKYNLYAFDEKKDGEDFYKCIQCTRYEHRGHKPSVVKSNHLNNENLEIWEKCNHYPSCSHDKSFIDKIQKKYHRSKHAIPASTSASTRNVSVGKKKLRVSSSISARGRPRKKRGAVRLKPNKKYSKMFPSRASNSISKDATIFLSLSSSLRKSQQIGKVQALTFASSVNRKVDSVVLQESVASTFSHLILSSTSNIATTSVSSSPSPPKKHFITVSPRFQSTTPLRSVRATTAPPHSHNPQNPETQRFQPKTLSVNENLYHCIPSTHDFREMLAILGIEFQSHYQVFWQSSYNINEINGISRPLVIHEMGTERNFGFQAFSVFLTSSEEAAFHIQESVKRYIYKSYYNAAAQELESYNNLMKSALCNFHLESIHFWVLAKILNVRIIVFENEDVNVYGDTFNNSIPSILLKKIGQSCWPVLRVHNRNDL